MKYWTALFLYSCAFVSQILFLAFSVFIRFDDPKLTETEVFLIISTHWCTYIWMIVWIITIIFIYWSEEK